MPSASDIWHLDEVVARIGDKKCWLWRVVDQDGHVLEEIVQTHRNTKAARRLLVRELKKLGCAPKRTVTDNLRSHGAAGRQVDRRPHKGLNNRAENSRLPLRKRERTRQGFRSIGSLQHFVSIFSATRNHFIPASAKLSADQARVHRQNAIAEWSAAALKLA